MTVYEKQMKEMTIEKLAQLAVKPAVVNTTDLFYVTTSGQLFPFTPEGQMRAIMLQKAVYEQPVDEDSVPEADDVNLASAD